MKSFLNKVRKCTVCAGALDHEPRPVLAAHPNSRIAIVGQAPGAVVHRTGIPWNDKSGETLRKWLGITSNTFYDEQQIALVPMGFCYPGKGNGGDLPPRKECAPLWHAELFAQMKNLNLMILVGKYSQDYYIDDKQTLTARVQNYAKYLPQHFVLPHPSPRNNIWQSKNSWFGTDVLPELKKIVAKNL